MFNFNLIFQFSKRLLPIRFQIVKKMSKFHGFVRLLSSTFDSLSYYQEVNVGIAMKHFKDKSGHLFARYISNLNIHISYKCVYHLDLDNDPDKVKNSNKEQNKNMYSDYFSITLIRMCIFRN